MPIRAKSYIWSVAIAGFLFVVASLLQWQSSHPLWYVIYLGVVLTASTVKLRLPGICGASTVIVLRGDLHFSCLALCE